MRCSNHEIGCKWFGQLGSLRDHLNDCGFVEVDCLFECNDSPLFKKDLDRHLTSECKMRTYECGYCGERDHYVNIQESHYSDCPEFPLPCPNNCSEVETFKRKLLDEHREICPLEKVGCPFVEEGCDATDLQ